MENKWETFEVRGCHIENLGRPAIFLIPIHRLSQLTDDGTIEQILHEYLMREFGAFTTTLIPSFGFWRNTDQKLVCDECRQYEVSFVGPERIPALIELLARICRIIGEDCLYFKAGQYACTIWPDS
ncbi:hypothetical protein KKC47_02550 [Patescibacteria group bacterium]|nr:hypothetical protein [Patescibacteria group bacterium]